MALANVRVTVSTWASVMTPENGSATPPRPGLPSPGNPLPVVEHFSHIRLQMDGEKYGRTGMP